MKILYFTDVHATGKSPQSRIDSYPMAIKNKLMDVKKMINDNGVNLVVIGGDLFHTDIVANKFTNDIIRILKTWNKTIYVVPGNHDLCGYNISTLEHSTLGILESSGVIKLLTRDKPIIGTLGGIKIAIEGQEYCVDIDEDANNYNKKVVADFNILFAHGMLQPKPILNSISHVLINDIPNPADITFCGHDHVGWGCVESNGKYFLNGGCVGRVDCSSGMKKHIPSAYLIDINKTAKDKTPNIDIKSIPFPSAKPFNEIFDINKISDSDNIYKDNFTNFIKTINNSQISNKLDQMDYINDMLDKGIIDTKIAESCKFYIEESKKSINSTNITSYNKLADNIYIKSISLKNFMSHKDSIVEFDSGFNTILGANNSGKSSILTALNWVFYDIPKGIEFLRTGSTTCEVKVVFSNGTYIRKTRTKTTGTYYIFDNTSADEKVFKGYGNNLPMDIVNIHQMPKVNLYKDKEESLNYASQLDGIFLLDTSPSEKAEALGKLTGADIIDDAITKVASETRNVEKEYKTLNKENKIITEEKNEAFNKLDIYIKNAEEYSKALEIVKTNYSIISLYNEVSELESNIITLKEEVLKTKKTSSIINRNKIIFNNAINILSIIAYIKKLQQEVNSISSDLNNEKKLIDIYSNKKTNINTEIADDILLYYKEKLKYNQLHRDFVVLKENIKAFPSDLEYLEIVTYLKEYIDLTKENSIILNNLNNEKMCIEKYKNNIISIDNNINKLHDYLHENGVCPTCNRALDEKSLEYIMNK